MAVTDLSIFEDFGSCEGFVYDLSDKNWREYLGSEFNAPMIIPRIAEEPIEKIGILKALYVEEERRGHGHGKRLLEQMQQAFDNEGVDTYILVADKEEDNEIDLVEWYQQYGFETVRDKKYCAVMIFGSEDLIDDCREITGYVPDDAYTMA